MMILLNAEITSLFSAGLLLGGLLFVMIMLAVMRRMPLDVARYPRMML
jgi:hypothetical protein